jgi:hypothetical protein
MRHEHRLGEITGVGRSASAAKKDALAQAERALTGSYDPVYVTFRGEARLAIRQPGAWMTWSLERRLPLGTWSDVRSREDVERSLRLDLAQATWDGAEDESPIVLDTDDRREFGAWVRWQKRWRFYRDVLLGRGKDGYEAGCIAHDIACGLRRPSEEGIEAYPGDDA